MENQEQLKEQVASLGRVFNLDKLVTKEDIGVVLEGVMKIMASFKKDNEKLTEEAKNAVENLLERVIESNDKAWDETRNLTSESKKELRQTIKSAKEDFKATVDKLKEMMLEVETMKPLDGKDADEQKIIDEVLAKIKLPEYKEFILTGEDIVFKINELDTDDEDGKIDASHIKNLPEFTQNITHEMVRTGLGNLEVYNGNTKVGSSQRIRFTGVTPTVDADGAIKVPITAATADNITGLIDEGSNITITGTGTSGDPYVISSTGGGGGHTIQDEGTPLTQRTNLNFVGAGVTVTDDSGNDATVVTISGGGGTIDGSGTTNEITYWVDSNTVGALPVATYPSLTELAHVKGVTSAIQTQLDGKLSDSGDTGTGTYNFTGSTVFRLPSNSNPTLSSVGAIAHDDTVTDWTDGLWKSYNGTGIYAFVQLPLSEMTNPSDGRLIAYNTSTNTFNLVVPTGGGDVTKVGTPANNQMAVWTGDGTLEGTSDFTYDGTNLNLVTGKNLQIAGATILADSAGTTTLSNIDALDATTEATIEGAIDTLANLTSIQGRTVTLADAGANAIFGWDDTAGAYENLSQAEVLAVIGDSSDTAKGVVELAITSEVNTGTDTARAVTPDALAGSYAGTKSERIYTLDANYLVTTGDGKAEFVVTPDMVGMNLVGCGAVVRTTSSSGLPTIQLARGRQANATTAHAFVDMLSTRITIDVGEYDSQNATTPAVIDTSNDDLALGDIIRVDIDTAGTGTKGMHVWIIARLP